MSPSVITFLVVAGVSVVVLFGIFALFSRFYHKVEQGHALIINPFKGEPKVTFTGGLVLPIINKAELMDISQVTPAQSRNSAAARITGRSESLPMTMPTTGPTGAWSRARAR